MHPIKIHPAWIKQFGAHTASVLGYLLQRRLTDADEEGWFTAPHRALGEATGIRPETYLSARKRLEEHGILETDKSKPQINKYRLHLEDLT